MTERQRTPWQVESLRLSAFVANAIDPMQTRYWEALLGAAPHDIRIMPQRRLAIEEGPALGGRVQAHIQPDRVDWHLVFDPADPAAEQRELPTAGAYDDMVPQFHAPMKRWLADFAPVSRLAFAAVLLQPAPGVPAACRILARLLPRVQIDIERTADFAYRINRRRASRSGIDGLLVNPLSSWSVMELTQGVMDFSAGAAPAFAAPIRRSVIRLELDINTAPNEQLVIEPAQTPTLLDELVDTGSDIAANGDAP